MKYRKPLGKRWNILAKKLKNAGMCKECLHTARACFLAGATALDGAFLDADEADGEWKEGGPRENLDEVYADLDRLLATIDVDRPVKGFHHTHGTSGTVH